MSEATTVEHALVLTKRDRCDRCGDSTRATVRVILRGGSLDFCGHHFTVNESALREQAEQVFDERDHHID